MKSILNSFLLIFTIFIISCSPTGSAFLNPDPIIPAEISTGTGMFIFTMNDVDFEVLSLPSSYAASSKVVFAMHGGGRDAEV